MTQTQTQLLPCPFCGGEAELEIDIIDVWLGQRLYTVECSNGECLAVSDRFAAPERATAWWNRRAESADLAALRQRVQELDEIRDAIGLCAAAVVLAYYRKTHDHILVDNDAIDAALKVEHWLGRR